MMLWGEKNKTNTNKNPKHNKKPTNQPKKDAVCISSYIGLAQVPFQCIIW